MRTVSSVDHRGHIDRRGFLATRWQVLRERRGEGSHEALSVRSRESAGTLIDAENGDVALTLADCTRIEFGRGLRPGALLGQGIGRSGGATTSVGRDDEDHNDEVIWAVDSEDIARLVERATFAGFAIRVTTYLEGAPHLGTRFFNVELLVPLMRGDVGVAAV